MKRLLLILLFLPVLVLAQENLEIPLPSPGKLGMISNMGASEIPLEAMRYSLNVDVFTKPGVLQRRVGLQYYGVAHYNLYGVSGYYNPYDNHRLIVGVHESTFVWFDTLDAIMVSEVGYFFVSDTFATNPDNGVAGFVFPYKDAYHDWLPYKDMLFHCDGKSTPSVITTSQTFHWQDSAFDSSGFQPRAISMGLEAPGQLRVGLTDISNELRGSYRYSYAFYSSAADTTGGKPISKMALPSAVLFPQNESPYLTQFEEYYSTPDSMYKLVLRQKMDGRAIWYVIDTIKPSSLDTTLTVLQFKLGEAYDRNNVQWIAYLGYTYQIILTTANGTVDTVAYVVGATDTVLIDVLRDAMIDSIEAGVLADTISVTLGNRRSFSLRTLPPCWDISATVDTGITLTTILDNYSYSSGITPIVYIDVRSDSSILSWQYSTVKCTITTVANAFAYSVSVGYNGTDTGMVNFTSDGSATRAEITDTIVALINAHDSLSLRVTAYDSVTYYLIKSDTLELAIDSVVMDANQDTSTIDNTRWNPALVNADMRQPGSLYRVGITLNVPEYYALPDSLYNIAYSYYDPATGLESPLGPTRYTTITRTSGKLDTVDVRHFSTGWPADGRPGWIRLYQGVVVTGLTGAGDTTIWYGLYQMRTRDSSRTIIWGNWTDDSVVVGLDTSLISVATIYSFQQFWTVSGDVVVQPPYHYDLQIPFSDMERAHFRFYGIGDPLCPNCLYFTPPDTIAWQSSLDNYFLIEPGGDKFVALEQLHDVLYAFKHGSIWYLAGYAAETETMWGRVIGSDVEVRQLTSAFGAISRETVVKYNDAIYFLTTKGKVMVIDGQGLREISQPIQDRIKTLFPTYSIMSRKAHLLGFENTIKLSNDSTGTVLSMHIPSQTWGLERFVDFTPTRMFIYDKTEGSMNRLELLFGDSTLKFRRQQSSNVRLDDAPVAKDKAFEWAAEFSIPGDGLNLYELQRLNFSLTPQSIWFLRYTVYNGDGDSLVADSIYRVIDDDGFLSWHVKQHDATMFPFVRLWGKAGELTSGGDPKPINNLFEIESIIFTVEKAGEPETE